MYGVYALLKEFSSIDFLLIQTWLATPISWDLALIRETFGVNILRELTCPLNVDFKCLCRF